MTSAGEAASRADCHDNRHSAVATATVTPLVITRAPHDLRLLRLKRAPCRVIQRFPNSQSAAAGDVEWFGPAGARKSPHTDQHLRQPMQSGENPHVYSCHQELFTDASAREPGHCDATDRPGRPEAPGITRCSKPSIGTKSRTGGPWLTHLPNEERPNDQTTFLNPASFCVPGRVPSILRSDSAKAPARDHDRRTCRLRSADAAPRTGSPRRRPTRSAIASCRASG